MSDPDSNSSHFKGNVIDLESEKRDDFIAKMMSNRKLRRSSHPIDYPNDCLLKVRGKISNEEITRLPSPPKRGEMGDHNLDHQRLVVLKYGGATNLTIGRANNFASYARHYFKDDKGTEFSGTSKEWPILSYYPSHQPFSAPGDSGSVIVDDCGRIGGLLTGGAGDESNLDITYATPIDFILERMQFYGLLPDIDSVLDA